MRARKSNIKATVFLILLMSTWYAAPLAVLADEFSNKTSAATTVVSPILYILLQNEEEKDPNNTVLTVEDMQGQVTGGITGSLNGVAEYDPLDAGISLRKLFYQKAKDSNLFTLQVDADSDESRALVASLKKPDSYSFQLQDNRVFHRLQHYTRGVDIDLNPGKQFFLNWEKAKVDGDVNLSNTGSVHLYGCYAYQTRSGDQRHSFFQLHRLNCTECHTVAVSRGISQITEDWKGGAYAKIGKEVALDAHVRSSEFRNNGQILTYNFGGPFGTSTLYPTNSSRDNGAGYQLYVGEGRYRLGAYGASLDRKNLATGQTVKNNYLSVQGVANVTDELALNAGYYTRKRDSSLATNLSTNQNRLYFQAAYSFSRAFNISARIGQENQDYTVTGLIQQGPYPTLKDRYVDVRGTFRPDSHWRLSAGYRDDTIDNPYFPTDPSRKGTADVAATYTDKGFTAGLKYQGIDSSNSVTKYNQGEFVAFMSAQFKNNLLANLCYTDNRIESNSSYNIFMDDPRGQFRLLQSGYPYWAKNNQFMASVTIPLGAKNPWRLTPMYRWSMTESNADLLPTFLDIPLDSRLKVQQDTYSFKLDFPLKKDGTRIGVGWEHNNWNDQIRSNFSGSYNTYMINFSKNY